MMHWLRRKRYLSSALCSWAFGAAKQRVCMSDSTHMSAHMSAYPHERIIVVGISMMMDYSAVMGCTQAGCYCNGLHAGRMLGRGKNDAQQATEDNGDDVGHDTHSANSQ